MSVLSIGECTWFNLYPLAVIILLFATNILAAHLSSVFSAQFYLITVQFFISFITILANFVFIIHRVVLSIQQRLKAKKKGRERLMTQKRKPTFSLIQSKGIPSIDRNSILLIIAISCIIIIGQVVFNMAYYNRNDDSFYMEDKLNILQIAIDAILSRVILKYLIYKHHILALIICIIGFTLFLSQQKISILIQWEFYVILIQQFGTGIIDISERYLMEIKNISPSDLLFYIGISGLPLCVIIMTILSFIKCPSGLDYYCGDDNGYILNIIGLLQSIEPLEAGLTVVLLILYSGYLFSYYYTLFYYTPTHKCIANVIGSLFSDVYFIGDGQKIFSWNWFTGNIVVILGGLIYNEVIILEFCNLSHYTKREIRLRADEKLDTELDEIEIEEVD